MRKLAVIVGRFQVPALHEGHKELLTKAYKENSELIVFLGIPAIQGTRNNPLDFINRKSMILSYLSSFDKPLSERCIVLPLADNPDDNIWSEILDAKIAEVDPFADVTLYGGRDSFIPHYKGKHNIKEIDEVSGANGDSIRQDQLLVDSTDFRAGIVYSAQNRPNHTHVYVTLSIVNEHKQTAYVKGKLPGAYLGDQQTLESCARSIAQDLGVEISNPVYSDSEIKNRPWEFRKDDGHIMVVHFQSTVVYESGRNLEWK